MPISVAYRSLLMPDWIVSTRGQRHLDMLKPAAFELTLDANRSVLHFHLHDDRRMRPAQQLRQHNTGLPVAEIVRLQGRSGPDPASRFDRLRKQPRDAERVETFELVFFDVDRPVRALRERFANRLRCTCRTGAKTRSPRPPFFSFSCRRFFERVSIRLIDLEVTGRLPGSSARVIDTKLRVARGNLFYCDDDLHER